LNPDGTITGQLLDKTQTRIVFERLLDDDSIIIVGANIAYDMAVMAVDALVHRGVDLMPKIFRAYALGRVFDIQHAEALHAVGIGMLGKDPRNGLPLKDPITGKPGRYSLAVCTDLILGRVDAKKNDEYRDKYALLEHVPLAEWPEPARQYPVDDAVNTLEDALAQAGHRPNVSAHQWGPNFTCVACGAPCDLHTDPRCITQRPRMNLHDLIVQTFKAWGLHLGACWGVRTDPVATKFLLSTVEQERDAVLGQFIEAGFIRPGDKSENQAVVKRAVALAYGCSGTCLACAGRGRTGIEFYKSDPTREKLKSGRMCETCNGTGLDLATGSVPRTDKGNVQIGRDILIESGDEFLMEYAGSQEDDKIADTYGPFLRECMAVPGNLRPNAILETGRVSYSGVIQTLPRQVSARLAEILKERREQTPGAPLVIGVRDCIVPRPGWVFDSEDYTGGELVTHAESCVELVGFSEMGKALNAGVDVHSALGATMMGLDYETFAKIRKDKAHPDCKRAGDFRQGAKPGNFGFPGRMGPAKLVLQQRKQGPDTPHPSGPSKVWDGKKFVPGYKGTRFCILIGGAERCGVVKVTEWNRQTIPPLCKACIEAASFLRESWMKQWPENVPYLKQVVPAAEERGYVVQHYSKRIRGGVDGGSIANGWFQAFLADITGRAQIRVSMEQYVRTIVRTELDEIVAPKPSAYEGCVSPLYGTRSLLFAHDELLGESPELIAADAAERKTEIMLEEFRRGCPRHAKACKAEPTLMRRWYKGAECVRDANGRLIPWEPRA
jgi:DNA polymerase-1